MGMRPPVGRPRCRSGRGRTMSPRSPEPHRAAAMTGVDAIRTALQSTQHLVTWFLSDLSDADLLVRAAPGANHISWQLGHLIVAEGQLAREQLPEAPYPELPAGFARQHSKET